MSITLVDWIIIAAFLLLSLLIGLRYRKQAEGGLADFFLGGRSLPWYIAGISMVATTFAADTPLAVTEIVANNGISGNWIWWSALIGGMLTTFFFARLWRRSGVLTELEFITLRYSGKEARFLRGFKSVYLGLFMNCMIIGWVNLAMMSILEVFFEIDRMEAWMFTGMLMVVAVIYSSLSGLKGIAITDTIQFFIAMAGTIILAVLVVNSEEVGSISGLKNTLHEDTFSMVPDIGSGGDGSTWVLSIGAFFSFVVIQWWASWYPGAEPGGGGYVAQRMMSTKTERDSVFATMFFQFAHYCLRPWPWILVGLCAIVLYSPEFSLENKELVKRLDDAKKSELTKEEFITQNPDVANMISEDPEVGKAVDFHFAPRMGYVQAMKDFLPSGLIGLLLVAFLAAYLSTISTQLNWGASYLVNDLYKPYLARSGLPDKKFVNTSRIATFGIMIIAFLITPQLTSIEAVWKFIMECGAGLGMVLILRWYWWRINAWSEIVATIAPFVGYSINLWVLEDAFGDSWSEHRGGFMFNVGFTTIAWMVVTFVTRPTQAETLDHFYKQVKPGGSWKKVNSEAQGWKGAGWLALCWLSAVIAVYSLLFATGKFIFMEWKWGFIWIIAAFVSFLGLRKGMQKTRFTAKS